MKAIYSLHLPLLLVGVLALAGCGNHHHRMHSNAAAAATAPLKANDSTPVVFGTYNKVAAVSGASLYFINLKNGDSVTSPVNVQFGLRGMGVAPAGIEKAATGHHHLLVDVAELDVNAGIPVSDQHRHFGAGQTETSIALKPGVHTLQLVLGDQNHIPHHPVVVSERITVTVK
jgi:hypothetical protein